VKSKERNLFSNMQQREDASTPSPDAIVRVAEGRRTTGWKRARRDGQQPRPAAIVVSRFELMTLPACLRARVPEFWSGPP
jgi:hypothetical protein